MGDGEGRKRTGKGRAATLQNFLKQVGPFDAWEAKQNTWERRRRELGTFGAASEVRHVDVATWVPPPEKPRSPEAPKPFWLPTRKRWR